MPYFFFDALGVGEILHNNVCGKSDFRCADCPNVKMMNTFHVWYCQYFFLYFIDIDLARGAVQCHSQTFFKQMPCGEEYNAGNDNAYDRVDKGVPC